MLKKQSSPKRKKMKQHLKRLAIPKTWPVEKKGRKFITRPSPSKAFELSIPLSVVFRDVLKTANSVKEVKHLLNNNYIFIDGIRQTDPRKSMGLMDTLEIKGTSEAYRLLLDKNGKLFLHKIKPEEAKLRPCKIIGKKLLKKGKMQINLLGSYNITLEKDDFKVGDVILLELPKKSVKEHLKLEKNCYIYLTGGNHVGRTGKLLEEKGKEIVFVSEKKEFRTLGEFAFVIGRDKPVITLEDG